MIKWDVQQGDESFAPTGHTILFILLIHVSCPSL